MALQELYVIQPAFTGGEISPDVASRVDLDKYQRSLLQAENACIRPYGAVRKRPGMFFCGATKYADRKCILYRFDYSVSVSYLLEIGHRYIRIWKNGNYLNVELATSYNEDELTQLRFVQSIDVLYICSGKYPVKKLVRYSETSWGLTDIDWTMPPFAGINENSSLTITPSALTGNITLTASGSLFTASMVGEWIKLCHFVGNKSVNGTVEPSRVTMGGEVDAEGRYTEEYISISNNEWTSSAVPVGKSWKIMTHGTWTGSISVQISTDNGSSWDEERSYHGSDDLNITESGDVEDYCMMRVYTNITSGKCNVNFSAYPYDHEGYVKITSVGSATSAAAMVKKKLGEVRGTADFYLSAWGEAKGYPNCATFFQDRLCFGGSRSFPQRVWMSKSGDYENFGVDKEEGSVTDDSAVTANLLSLKTYSINHMTAGNDLIIMTDGNEWSISGGETVTPSSMTPRNQQNNGCSDILPIRVGNRMIYVQRRGSIVRDIGYNYDTDSYVGADLTLLAKHLIRDKELVSGCYQQEPDSMIYLVRDDGMLLCLAYIAEQNVYAWSRMKTDGAFEALASCQQGNNDVTYAVVKRTVNGQTKRYIERMDKDHDSSSQQAYVMLDCAVHYQLAAKATDITGLYHLEGKAVHVLADGYLYESMTVANGTVVLPEGAKDIIVGLPYTMIIEQPNFDTTLKGSGTVQGRKKVVTSCILRLHQSYGGAIGPDAEHLNNIIYETGRLEQGEDVLFTGDKRVTMANGGFNNYGRVYIRHDKPYPFNLGAIVRVVSIGG